MPNLPAAIGRGITVLYANAQLAAADRRAAETLMASLGETLWLNDESLMDAVTAVSGSGPAYVFLMVEAFAEAARASRWAWTQPSWAESSAAWAWSTRRTSDWPAS